MTQYHLGTGIGELYQYQSIPIAKPTQPPKDKPIITNKILAIFAVVAVVKIDVLIML